MATARAVRGERHCVRTLCRATVRNACIGTVCCAGGKEKIKQSLVCQLHRNREPMRSSLAWRFGAGEREPGGKMRAMEPIRRSQFTITSNLILHVHLRVNRPNASKRATIPGRTGSLLNQDISSLLLLSILLACCSLSR